jgi:hypothetical protein
MPSSDNRPARLTLLVVAAIAALTVIAWFAAGKWAVFVPFAGILLWRLGRATGTRAGLAAKGWSGRRFKNYWVYEEQQGKERPSLSLKLEFEEPDRYILVVPGEAEWRRTMPLWAAARRDEIMERVTQSWAPEDVRWPAVEQKRKAPRQSRP